MVLQRINDGFLQSAKARHERAAGTGTGNLCRKLAALMLFAALSGCTQTVPIQNLGQTQMVSTETAFATPAPGGPTVTAVLERHFANAIQQDILLSTSARMPGQNMLRVEFFGPVDTASASDTRLRDGYLPIGDVGSEMRKLLPGVRMGRSPFYVQNKYGPFGYAAGRSASGDTCLYAWQRITSTGSTQTLIGNRGSIQIRLRLCDQQLSERALLSVMYGFTISSYFMSQNWNPYGAPASPDASLGKSGNPIYPIGATKFETVTTAQPAPPKVEHVVKRRVVVASQPKVEEPPQAIGPLVPAPPSAEANSSKADSVIGSSQGSGAVVPGPPTP
jgi:hypothetical protein